MGVLKNQSQRKQHKQRKEERKQPGMNNGSTDEFTAVKKTTRGEDAQKGSVCMRIYTLFVLHSEVKYMVRYEVEGE